MLAIFLGVCLILALLYIHRLKMQLHGYEHIWEQIKNVADKNQDGTFLIDVRHMQDLHAEQIPLDHSGVHLVGANPNTQTSRAA